MTTKEYISKEVVKRILKRYEHLDMTLGAIDEEIGGISNCCVGKSQCCNGKYKWSQGYMWEFKN